MSLLFGAIADDLTGGLEVAAMLRAEGVGCDFVSDTKALDSSSNSEAIVVALRTRVAPKAEAVARSETTATHLLKRGARQIFFKYCATFDSTNEGNIGPCADALAHATGAAQTLFCPAFPEAGRRIFQGHLFADDQLISESPKRYDPLTPMTDPNLVRVLQTQTKMQVGLLPHQTVRAGVAAMNQRCAELRAAAKPYAIADAATPTDLEAIAELTVNWPLMTGNSSVAAYYPKLWRERALSTAIVKPDVPPIAGPGIVLAGSCAERTLKQLEVFGAQRPVRFIDLHDAQDHDVVQAAIDWALPLLSEGPVAIATSAPPEAIRSVQSRWGQREAAGMAEAILGRIALGLREAGVTRFLIAGGESSGAVLEHLQVQRLRVGAYKAPGIAQATSEGGSALALCLKSGTLGPEDMMLPMLESMARGEG
jgi:3-dehydrotetronate 4-kinase